MNLPPKAPRFALPVSGAKVGSIARPVADGVATPITSAGQPIAKPRFGMRSNTRTLASLRPAVTPAGSLPTIELHPKGIGSPVGSLAPDGEVA
jgi:hypothetical protein